MASKCVERLRQEQPGVIWSGHAKNIHDDDDGGGNTWGLAIRVFPPS